MDSYIRWWVLVLASHFQDNQQPSTLLANSIKHGVTLNVELLATLLSTQYLRFMLHACHVIVSLESLTKNILHEANSEVSVFANVNYIYKSCQNSFDCDLHVLMQKKEGWERFP